MLPAYLAIQENVFWCGRIIFQCLSLTYHLLHCCTLCLAAPSIDCELLGKGTVFYLPQYQQKTSHGAINQYIMKELMMEISDRNIQQHLFTYLLCSAQVRRNLRWLSNNKFLYTLGTSVCLEWSFFFRDYTLHAVGTEKLLCLNSVQPKVQPAP